MKANHGKYGAIMLQELVIGHYIMKEWVTYEKQKTIGLLATMASFKLGGGRGRGQGREGRGGDRVGYVIQEIQIDESCMT